MTTARRVSLFRRVEQRVDAVFHGPVDLNGGVIGILDTGRERAPRTLGAAARILFGPPDPPPPDRPSAWLDPRAGVLPPVARREVGTLLEWCRDPDAPTARLVTGAGGQGKTHLAAQVSAALRESRRGRTWLAGFVTPVGARMAPAVRALGRFRLAGALLVVDYAEGHERLVRELLEAAGPRVRVLVLARTTPHWWRELVDSGPRRWAEPEALHLDTLPDARTLWADAVTVFSHRLGRRADTAAPPEHVASTLDLYASALLRALDPEAVDADPLTGVLRHERAAFLAGARRAGLTDGGWRDLALSAAVLRDAATVTEGAQLLHAVPELRHLGEHGLRAAAKALAAAYPADGRTLWRAPKPDRLADTHLLATAETSPTEADWTEFVHAVCATGEPAVVDHAAQVLTRALTTPGADRHHAEGIRRLGASLVSLAHTEPAYVPALARLDPVRFRELIVARTAEIPLETVAVMDADLATTGATTSRIPIAVAVSRRLAAVDPRHLPVLSTRLAEAGDLNGALDAARLAVERIEDQADRAAALTALSHRLAEHDQLEEALVCAEEAADLRSEAPPEVRGYALHNLAMRLAGVGRVDDAVTAAGAAAELLLAAGHHLRPRLAAALVGLAQVLDAAGFPGRAVPPAREAVRILRELAGDRPDAHLPDLAAALVVLSRSLASAEPAAATDLAAEAVAAYTDLAEREPAAFTSALAAAHMNLGLRRAATDRDGTRELRRAVELYEPLAAADPEAHRPALAAALLNVVLHRAEDGVVDLACADRAVALQRARSAPGADLPAALADLGYLRAAAGQLDEARAATTEAVEGFRGLLAAEPSALHRVWLADALLDSARHLFGDPSTGGGAADADRDEVRDLVLEAAELYAAVEGEQPDTAWSRFQEAMALCTALDDDQRIPQDARRYCRRWREAVVRVPLPGVAALVVWRTDRAPRRERTRMAAGEQIYGLGGPSGTHIADVAAATTAPAVVRLVIAVGDRVRAATGRMAARPAVQPVVQYVQQHPAALARAGGVIAGVALLLSAATPDPVRGRVEALPAPPPATSSTTGTPSTSTTTALPTTTTRDPSGAAMPTAGPRPPDTAPSAPRQPPPPALPPGTEDGVTREPVVDQRPVDGDVAVDLSGTSYREFRVVGEPGPWRDGRHPQGFDLEPGTHQIETFAGPLIVFTVTAARTVDYPKTMDGYLFGRGSTTLAPRGRAVTVDVDDTDYTRWYLLGTGTPWLDARRPRSFMVLPGQHQVFIHGGPRFVFTVDGAGHVAYTGGIAPYLSGTGSAALAVHGRPVTVDAGPTDYSGLILLGVDTGWRNAETPRTYRLVPGAHVLITQDTVQTVFTVDDHGTTRYADTLDPVFDGAGSRTLTVVGAATTIDATATPYDLAYVHGAGGWRSTGAHQTYRLLPGAHHLALHGGPTHRFVTDNQGRVDYAGSLDGVLAGRGTTTLTTR
jgi:tetratricopeptide (TPR) repeat protein